MLSDEQLAEIGHTAMIKSVVAHPDSRFDWERLPTPKMMELTAFAAAVREAIENEWKSTAHSQLAQDLTGVGKEKDEDKKTAEHFRESVDIAFQQMSIWSTKDKAAWYTLRDWLKETSKT